jgi:hypothetical protein
MIDLFLFVLFVPIALVWAMFRLVDDVLQFFGFWVVPAVLSSYFGVYLYLVGPSTPDAAFESIVQWLSGYVVFGLRLPLLLLIAGIGTLLTAATFRTLRRNDPTVGH